MSILNYYIVPKSIHDTTDWVAAPGIEVGPVYIWQGAFAGNYAVNTAIFGSDKVFEKYRGLLSTLSTAELDPSVFVRPDQRDGE